MLTELYWISLFFVSGCTGKIIQLEPLVTAEKGHNVSLSCFHPETQINKVLWYKQTLGKKPLLITSSFYYNLPFDFHNGFDKEKRLNMSRSAGSSNLTISRVEHSDSAVYYCAGSFSNIVSFGSGTVLVIKGQHPDANKYSILQHNVSQLKRPGDSVTLQCTAFTLTCSGEHSVYWLRHGSGESPPGIIYTHGDTNSQCSRSSETDPPTQSCVYKLPKTNLSLSDAGTYYCAVAVCGQILFGNGTKLSIGDEHRGESIHIIMVSLGVLLFISLAINLCLCLICKNNKTSQITPMTSDGTESTVQCNLNNEMSYAALKFTTKSTKVKRVTPQEETVYSGVKRQKKM
ncbi:uncharacterized protein [Hoplias malabaricus]|uniref:uncharacterized protein n=1 Tax=Hoplias malabaricus TaxID=27720 RepID=UPI003462E769